MSEREYRVFLLIAAVKPKIYILYRSLIGILMVSTYRTGIFQKMNFTDQAEKVRSAFETWLI
jgi:DNA-binding CsgD family transcriptional regulator